MSILVLVLLTYAVLLSGTRIIEADDGERYLYQPNEAEVHRSIIPGPEGLPFSKAVRVGETLYLAGNIGLAGSKGGEPVLVEGGVEAETKKGVEGGWIQFRQGGQDDRDDDGHQGLRGGQRGVRQLLQARELPRPVSLRGGRPAPGSQGGDRGRSHSRGYC